MADLGPVGERGSNGVFESLFTEAAQCGEASIAVTGYLTPTLPAVALIEGVVDLLQHILHVGVITSAQQSICAR